MPQADAVIGPGAERRLPVLLLAMLASFLVPDILALQIGPVKLPMLRLMVIIAALPAALRFVAAPGARFYAFDGLFFFFCLWTGFCVLLNYGADGGIEKFGVLLLEYLFVYIIIQNSITSVVQFQRLISIFILIIAIVGGLGVLESLVFNGPAIQNFAHKIAGKGGFVIVYGFGTENFFRWGHFRAMTVFTHPILYGLFCAVFFAYAWYLGRTVKAKLIRCGVVFCATFVSLSGGPLMTMAVQIGLIGVDIVTRKLPNRLAIVGVLGLAFMLFVQVASQSGVYRLVQMFTFDGGSAYYRTLIWEHGIDDVLRNPIFGMRPEDWTRLEWMPPSIDNYWLVQAMLGGFPGVGALILSIVALSWRLFRRPDHEIPEDLALIRRAWIYSMTATCVCGATVFFFDKAQPLFAILVGLGGASCRLLDRWELSGAPLEGARPSPQPAPQPRTAI